MSKTKSRDALEAAHERLTQAVEAIVSGDDWKCMLKVSAKFHRYSCNNQLLIFLQRPDATLVAGFRRWQELGRQVRQGERGISILAPCRYRTKIEDEQGDEQTVQRLAGFRVTYVFDVSQTDGEPLEDLDAVRPKLLEGDAPAGLWDALVAQATAAGFDVVRHRRGSENGYCDFGSRQIGVRPDVPPAQAVKTLVHELAHALLHGDRRDVSRDIAEVEVESVAYIVLDAVGLASDDYSFPYVARWASGDVSAVKATAERVIQCAGRIIGGLGPGSQGRWIS